MGLEQDFREFCKRIKLDNYKEMKTSAGEIAKKLNKVYYELESEQDLHMYIVGSVGRNTAIKGSSDLDLLFDFPKDIFKKYDSYESNGQSQFLQDVKKILQERYPNTDISGDGQVVVIDFNKYTVELVPGFKQSDNTFKYPDTHNGGSWKTTDPIREQKASKDCNNKSLGIYYDFCHILRGWKNTVGFKMKGLLIDTLVYTFLYKNNYFKNSEASYLDILISIFNYLSSHDNEQKYWYALGSNQLIYNTDKGTFVEKAKKAYDKIKDLTLESDNANDLLRLLLGNLFPKVLGETNKSARNLCLDEHYDRGAITEEFIEDKFPVDIRYHLIIDCNVTQNGWKPFLLSTYLIKSIPLRKNKQLDFFISKTDCPEPYKVYWKVRNVGPEAIRRNMIRGNIAYERGTHHKEKTDFVGAHYVECYLIKNNVCVARDKIDVPIGDL